MPEPTAPSQSPAADAAPTATTTDGATPPKADATASTETMSAAEADRVLNSLSHKPSAARDPLTDETGGEDPLTFEGADPFAALEGELPESAPAEEDAPVEAEGEAEVDAETETGASETEAEPETATVEEEHAAGARKRLNINRKDAAGNYVHSDFERAQMALAAEEGISLAEAGRRLGGDKTQASEAPAAQAAKPDALPTTADIDAQIAGLETKIEEAEVLFDDNAVRALEKQIRQLLPKRQDALLRDAERHQSQRQQQSTLQQQSDESRGKAVELYPDAGKEGTALNKAVQAESDRLHATNSPLLTDPDWPETLVAKHANRLGIAAKIAAATEAKPKAAPAAPKTAAVPPRRATPLLAPGAVSSPKPATNPRAELEKQIDAAGAARDLPELDRLMEKAIKLERAA